MIFFGLAIHFDWVEDLSPRAANRPKSVMKNSLLRGIPNHKHRDKFYFYPIAWLIWSYKLTYRDCLLGIPGTGTRKNGWEGPLLKTNLDAVILLKFHTLLFKIAVLVAVLCTVIILPVNYTAGCNSETLGVGTCTLHEAQSVGFVRTTIAHVPDKIYNNNDNATPEDLEISASSILSAIKGDAINVKTTNSSTAYIPVTTVNKFWVADQTWRVFATMSCCLVIYVFTFYLLHIEWIENIALRRAFFLEANHHKQRMRELNKLELDFFSKRKKEANRSHADGASDSDGPNDENKTTIPPFMTHPEIRETPPSVGIYSVLYKLPQSMITYDTDGATQVERQLVATSKFFEDIIPPQPGYSSSVVAVTVIPNARLVAIAWTKWTKCEIKLQTLRHIGKLIAENEGKLNTHLQEQKKKLSRLLTTPTDDGQHNKNDQDTMLKPTALKPSVDIESINSEGVEVTADQPVTTDTANDIMSLPEEDRARNSHQSDIFRYEDFDVEEYAKSLGFCDELENMVAFVNGMGIEEFNVFAYNCALLAGGVGLNKKVLNLYSVETLKEEEADLREELKEAQDELLEARANVVKLEDDTKLKSEEYSAILKVDSKEKGERNHEASGKLSPYCTDSNEWGLTEHELRAMLPVSETFLNESNGKIQILFFLLQRIFYGSDSATFPSHYYGTNADNTGEAFKTDVERPAYAVVTFSSRHSAIVARQCLADGAATNSWKQVDDIPIYPIADAPSMMCFPRGFMRPVTPTISYSEKKIRRWTTIVLLVLFTSFYIVPINFINRFIWYSGRETIFGRTMIANSISNYASSLSGLTQSLLFSICPVIFKLLANFEGSSSSMQKSEQRSMIFFWYFYIIARFMGQIVFDSIHTFLKGDAASVEDVVYSALTQLAQTVPTALGPAALSYVIFTGTITWPALYWLQLNNFLTSICHLDWINRMLKGGGPGAEVPYRIYVDSGYILACMTSLAPLCPLIGPFVLLYFVIISPMLRWLMVFGYRPKFDGGGDKWPHLHHIVVTSLLLGQLITSLSFFLKGNVYQGLTIACCIIPTFLYDSIIMEKYMRSFSDASLLQTGKIYKSNTTVNTSMLEREEFRRWLVDCHKASYLPTCLSGGRKNLLTAEPAEIIQRPGEKSMSEEIIGCGKDLRQYLRRQQGVKGGSMRRQRFNI